MFTYFHSRSQPETTNPPGSTVTQEVTGQDNVVIANTEGNVSITNIHGISEETALRLASELGITRSALTSFFKILEQKNIPPGDLDSTLREIARRHNVIKEQLRLFSSDDPEVTSLKHQAAEALDVGDFDRAEPLLNEAKNQDIHAAKGMQEMAEKRLLSAASSAAEIGALKYIQLAYTEAAKYYREASELVPPEEESVLVDYLNSWGLCLMHAGNFQKAEEPLNRSLKIRENTLGPDHPDVATSLNNLAGIYNTQNKYTKAEPLCERALKIRENALDPDHPDVATSLNNLATLYDNQSKYSEAEPLHKRALAIRKNAHGPDHPDVAASLNNLAVHYDHQDKSTEAEPLYNRALTIFENAYGPNHPDVATVLSNLVVLYRQQGKYNKAESLYERALKIRENTLGPDHPGVASARNNFFDLQGKICKDIALPPCKP